MEQPQPWIAITQDAYRAALKSTDGISLITPLLPDVGKAKSARTIACRKFEGIFGPLSDKFTKPWYFNDTGCEPRKYTERLYLQHTASGEVLCLGTYWLTEWRVWGPDRLRHLVDDLCRYVGIPIPTPEIIAADQARTAALVEAFRAQAGDQ